MTDAVEPLSNAGGVASGTRSDARPWEICESFYGPTVPLLEPCDKCRKPWSATLGARPCYMWACATWIILISCYLRWSKAFERVFPDPLDYKAFVNAEGNTPTSVLIYGMTLCLDSLSFVLKETTAHISAAWWCSKYRPTAANAAPGQAAANSDPSLSMAAKSHLRQLCHSQWLRALTGRCVNVTRMGTTRDAKWPIRILNAILNCSCLIIWDACYAARTLFLVLVVLFAHARRAIRTNTLRQFGVMALIQLRKGIVYSFLFWILALLVRYVVTSWEFSTKGVRPRSLPPNFPYLPDGRQFVSSVFVATVLCYCFCNYRLPSRGASGTGPASTQPHGQRGIMQCYMSAFAELPPRQHTCRGFSPLLLAH